jgi:hypothetical protein
MRNVLSNLFICSFMAPVNEERRIRRLEVDWIVHKGYVVVDVNTQPVIWH